MTITFFILLFFSNVAFLGAKFFSFFSFYHTIKFPVEFLFIYLGFFKKQIHLTTCTSLLVRKK